jgi:bifunctional non-homologous end joining protein LigD
MIHRIDPPLEESDPFPDSIVPMTASPGELPDDGADWGVEVKWDGVRAIAYCRPGRVRLENRELEDISAGFPEVRRLARQVGARDAILDGELVVFDEDGLPSGERLGKRLGPAAESTVRRRMKSHPVTYAIFDLLYLDGKDLMGEPYRRRRRLLEELGLDGESWQTPSHSVDHARELLEASRERGLGGLVLKRLESRYVPGKRSAEWLRVSGSGSPPLRVVPARRPGPRASSLPGPRVG